MILRSSNPELSHVRYPLRYTVYSCDSHVDFNGGRKTGEPGEKPSWHRREQHIKQTRTVTRVVRGKRLTTAPLSLKIMSDCNQLRLLPIYRETLKSKIRELRTFRFERHIKTLFSLANLSQHIRQFLLHIIPKMWLFILNLDFKMVVLRVIFIIPSNYHRRVRPLQEAPSWHEWKSWGSL